MTESGVVVTDAAVEAGAGALWETAVGHEVRGISGGTDASVPWSRAHWRDADHFRRSARAVLVAAGLAVSPEDDDPDGEVELGLGEIDARGWSWDLARDGVDAWALTCHRGRSEVLVGRGHRVVDAVRHARHMVEEFR